MYHSFRDNQNFKPKINDNSLLSKNVLDSPNCLREYELKHNNYTKYLCLMKLSFLSKCLQSLRAIEKITKKAECQNAKNLR